MSYIDGLFAYLQATLYACLDFQFIQVSTVLCFIIIYLPCAFISYYILESQIALVISYNIPIIILVLIYLYRIYRHILIDLDNWVTKKLGITESSLQLRQNILIGNPSLLAYNDDDEKEYTIINKNSDNNDTNDVELDKTATNIN